MARPKSALQLPKKDFFILTAIGFLTVATFAITHASNTRQNLAPKAANQENALTGNQAPSGPHYNLNLIGVPKGKTATITTGHRIFVPLEGKTTISLSQGDFAVIDGNGTDGKATFQLPNPDPDNNGTTQYSVWARALGKPGGKSTTTTCAYDALGEMWCSVYQMVMVRNKGKSSFENVTQQLLYIYADINQDGTNERYPLFSDALQNYFWNYDNNGLKLVQLRFYELPTQVQ